MDLTVLLNARAGSADDEGQREEIAKAFAAAGVRAEVCGVEGEKLKDAARSAASRSAIVVAAGGDGTVRSVAMGVMGTKAALGVMPLGTYNHFAKELEMPLDPAKAAEAIARGSAESFAIGEVNGEAFLSFVAMGLHARAVRHREAQRRALGRNKLLSMALALVRSIRQPPVRRYRIMAEDIVLARHSPSLVVASNQYQIDVLGLAPERPPGREQMSVCLAHARSRWGVVRMLLHGLLGRLHEDFEVLHFDQFMVSTRQRAETAVLDGELITLQTPMRFRSVCDSLRVIRPPEDLREKPPQQIAARG